MSILKGILHHWNKTTKSYDTIHPETEVAQITDWNNGIVNTLASTALGTLVSTLTSDSLLALLIKKVFDATGVKYNIAQNGYVCFGSLVGGLIIQWGLFTTSTISDEYTVSYPLAFSNQAIPVATKEDLKEESHRDFIIVNFNTKYFTFATKDTAGIACLWIAIGV